MGRDEEGAGFLLVLTVHMLGPDDFDAPAGFIAAEAVEVGIFPEHPAEIVPHLVQDGLDLGGRFLGKGR